MVPPSGSNLIRAPPASIAPPLPHPPTSRHRSACPRMCGCDSIVSYRPGEIVNVSRNGEPSQLGMIDDVDHLWGVRVVWTDGRREWFSYDMWCPLSFDRGFSMILTDGSAENTSKFADIPPAPPEVGRGWLPVPPQWSLPVVCPEIEEVEVCESTSTRSKPAIVAALAQACKRQTEVKGPDPTPNTSAILVDQTDCGRCPQYLSGQCVPNGTADDAALGGPCNASLSW